MLARRLISLPESRRHHLSNLLPHSRLDESSHSQRMDDVDRQSIGCLAMRARDHPNVRLRAEVLSMHCFVAITCSELQCRFVPILTHC
jgi:hypothetical protein